MALYLIRHPAPRVDSGLCYGRTDLDLLHAVDGAVRELRPQLPERYTLYSSPLRRCSVLAQALEPRVIYDSRLAEMDFGSWELQPWEQIGAATLDAWIDSGYDSHPHGGESLQQFRERVLDWAGALDGAQPVVAVTHAGVIRMLLAWVRGRPVHECLRLPIPFASVTRLQLPLRAGGEP